MDRSTWFTTPLIGNMAPAEATLKLREIGEVELAQQLEETEQNSVFYPVRGDKV